MKNRCADRCSRMIRGGGRYNHRKSVCRSRAAPDARRRACVDATFERLLRDRGAMHHLSNCERSYLGAALTRDR
jgi:hypothetical protein